MDIVNKQTRSRMMGQISANDTKPEMIVRRGLHARGLRYRLHEKSLPGRPDLYFPKYSAVIQVHGCFWHVHKCPFFKWPTTNAKFWRTKLSENEVRDKRTINLFNELGIRSLIIWECAFRGQSLETANKVIADAYTWVTKNKPSSTIPDFSS